MRIWILQLYNGSESISMRFFASEGAAYKALISSPYDPEPGTWDHWTEWYISPADVEGA